MISCSMMKDHCLLYNIICLKYSVGMKAISDIQYVAETKGYVLMKVKIIT